MKPANVKRILYFAKEGPRVVSPQAFRNRYGFYPDGVNFYYGMNAAAVRHLRERGNALQPYHRQFFDMVQEAVLTGPKAELLVNLGLWPYEPGDPYGFVARNLELVRRVAEELHDYQERARTHGKRLEIVVRYASEMNDPFQAVPALGSAAGTVRAPLRPAVPRHVRPGPEDLPRARPVHPLHLRTRDPRGLPARAPPASNSNSCSVKPVVELELELELGNSFP